MKSSWLLVLLLLNAAFNISAAQTKTGEAVVIDELNQAIDNAVVKKDIAFLEKHYGDDFVFTHGTGHIDSKSSWIQNIGNMGQARFISRDHDSTVVELHGEVAILAGKLSVKRESESKQTSGYALRYIRVFARRNGDWQLISHRTTSEWR